MQFSFDGLNRYEIPVLTLANPNMAELAIIPRPKDLRISLNLLDTSELTFRASSTDGSWVAELKKYRLIHADGFGWFVITSADPSYMGEYYTVEIKCLSYENTLNKKSIDLEGGTYRLFDPMNPHDENTIVGHVLNRCPRWSVGNISAALHDMYRTFDNPDDSVYGFLMSEAAEAYECLFVFDVEDFRISAYTAEDLLKETNVVLRYTSLLKNVSVNGTNNDVISCLNVYGASDFSIASVNPLGTASIYKFDYYKDWMSDGLWEKVATWQEKVNETATNTDAGSYSSLLASVRECSAEKLDLQAKYAEVLSYEKSGQQVLAIETPYTQDDTSLAAVTNIKTWIDGLDVDDLTSTILAAISYPPISFEKPPAGIAEYVGTIGEQYIPIAEASCNIYACEKSGAYLSGSIEALDVQVEELRAAISAITEELSFAENFTAEELVELDDYIITENYENTYVVNLDTFTYEQTQDLAMQLMREGQNQLTRLCRPSYEISADVLNFLFNNEFVGYRNEVVEKGLGCQIHLEVKEDEWVSPVLLSIGLSYDAPETVELGFGSTVNSKLTDMIWEDLFQESSKTSSTVNSNIHDLVTPLRDGTISRMQEFMGSTLDASRNAIVSSSNQELRLDEFGLVGRKLNEDGSGYEDEQVKLVNNSLCFTDDSWETVKLALGKLDVGGTSAFGIVAEYLVGEMIIGESLVINNESNTFAVDSSGASLKNASFAIENDTGANSLTRIIMDPVEGFKIQTRPAEYQNYTWANTPENVIENKLTADMEGNIQISGSLTSVGSVAGWENQDALGLVGSTEESNYARLGGSNYAFSAGNVIDGAETPKFSVSYNGDINALTGKIGTFSVDESAGIFGEGNLKVGEMTFSGSTALGLSSAPNLAIKGGNISRTNIKSVDVGPFYYLVIDENGDIRLADIALRGFLSDGTSIYNDPLYEIVCIPPNYAPSVPTSNKQQVIQINANGNGMNTRSGPSTSSSKIGNVYVGELYSYRIETGSDGYGWAYCTAQWFYSGSGYYSTTITPFYVRSINDSGYSSFDITTITTSVGLTT